MHYIRLLKAPRMHGSGSQGSISTTITITTDLGEDFYHADTKLEISIKANDITHGPVLARRQIRWHGSMRALPVELPFAYIMKLKSFFLVIKACDDQAGALRVDGEELHLPCILSMTTTCTITPPGRIECDRMIVRSISLEQHGDLHIWEESGDSIARHVW